MKFLIAIFFLPLSITCFAQKVAVLKYGGGGDWYSNPTSLPNLVKFSNQNLETTIDLNIETVSPSDSDIFDYPFVHMTGHGNVYFNDEEVTNLRNYLLSGGFLHIDDNFGLDEFIRKEIIKIFPDINLIELTSNHPIFSTFYKFPQGLPKIHEHNNSRPQAFGITVAGRLVLLYTYESDLGDGWENPEVHNDPAESRSKALKMGANILKFAFEN